MKIKKLNTKQIRKLLDKSVSWYEGLTLVGYWEEGKSFILSWNGNQHICISENFINKLKIK